MFFYIINVLLYNYTCMLILFTLLSYIVFYFSFLSILSRKFAFFVSIHLVYFVHLLNFKLDHSFLGGRVVILLIVSRLFSSVLTNSCHSTLYFIEKNIWGKSLWTITTTPTATTTIVILLIVLFEILALLKHL